MPTAAEELARRARGPQRHRLLHGYPLAAAVPPVPPDLAAHLDLAFGARPLIVGVLPHPFCNPAVTGCGFCTFPHEPGNRRQTAPVVRAVAAEVRRRVSEQLTDLLGAAVKAVYFGGGTANLCEPEGFRALCRELATGFDLTGAEATLEGVPAYFLHGPPRLLEVMRAELKCRHCRLSMGIQTFDPARLAQMGRTAFGDAGTFRAAVELAHGLGCTASGDLLFNLSGQTLDEMRADVLRAIDLGLDHIGLYHLVLFRGLGTPWADDAGLLAELPDNERACENWLALRDVLLARGWVQTSLTNFEQGRYRNRPERYQYEELSFRPDGCEAIGFGPGAISYCASADFRTGLKVLNPDAADAYTGAATGGRRVWDRAFAYDEYDQRVLWLTRRLAALEIDRHRYRALFGTDAHRDFQEQWDAAEAAGFVAVTGATIRPTPRGMFYADAVAATLATPAVKARRAAGAARRAPPAAALLHDPRADHNAFAHM